jgi:hypothetical protein
MIFVALVPRLCHSAEGELEQIQFLLGHVSVQTTEKYLGCHRLAGVFPWSIWIALLAVYNRAERGVPAPQATALSGSRW